MKRIKGFTLTELMVAATLGLILLMMVGYTLNNASRAVNGTMKQVAFQTRMRNIIRFMRRDIESMVPTFMGTYGGSPVRFPNTANLPIGSNNFGLIFLCKVDNLTTISRGSSVTLDHDLIWVYYMVSNRTDNVKLQRWWFPADPADPGDLSAALATATGTGGTMYHDLIDLSINASGSAFSFVRPDFSASPTPASDITNNVIKVTITLYDEASEDTKEFTFDAAMPVR